MQPPINYSALQKYESPKAQARWEKLFASKKRPSNIKKVFLILAIVIGIFIVSFAAFVALSAVVGKFGFAVFGLAIAGLIIFAVRKNRQLQKAAVAFAADNGWQVLAAKPDIRIASITPQDNATTVSIPGAVISGKLDGCDFWSYQYRCTTRQRTIDAQGNPTTQSSTVEYHVLTVALPGPLPVFFLDSQMDGNQEQRSGWLGGTMQRLSLEGNFDNFFRLYQQPGSQIDVLSIITPEFMQALMDSGAFLNIESDGRQIHFISTYGSLLNCTPTRYLFEQSRQVLARIMFKLHTYQPSVPTVSQPTGVSAL